MTYTSAADESRTLTYAMPLSGKGPRVWAGACVGLAGLALIVCFLGALGLLAASVRTLVHVARHS